MLWLWGFWGNIQILVRPLGNESLYRPVMEHDGTQWEHTGGEPSVIIPELEARTSSFWYLGCWCKIHAEQYASSVTNANVTV